jgi:hypothetical protein
MKITMRHIASKSLIIFALTASACHHATRPGQPMDLEPDARSQGHLPATGISACDNYLSTYLSCHRAAGIYPPDQLQRHYTAMRDDLLSSAHDPMVRPLLAQRCMVMIRQLSTVLNGRSCQAAAPVQGSH